MRLAAKDKMAKYLKNENRTGNLPNPINMDDATSRICALYGEFGTGLCIPHEMGIYNPARVKSKFI